MEGGKAGRRRKGQGEECPKTAAVDWVVMVVVVVAGFVATMIVEVAVVAVGEVAVAVATFTSVVVAVVALDCRRRRPQHVGVAAWPYNGVVLSYCGGAAVVLWNGGVEL